MPTRITHKKPDGTFEEIRVIMAFQNSNARIDGIKEVIGKLDSEDAIRLLKDLYTQLERSNGWFARGFLRLAYTDDRNHVLELKRKTWVQMLWHDNRNAETDELVEYLIMKTGLDIQKPLRDYLNDRRASSASRSRVEISTLKPCLALLNLSTGNSQLNPASHLLTSTHNDPSLQLSNGVVSSMNLGKKILTPESKQLASGGVSGVLLYPQLLESSDDDFRMENKKNQVMGLDFLHGQKVAVSIASKVYELKLKDGELLYKKSGIKLKDAFPISHKAFLRPIIFIIEVKMLNDPERSIFIPIKADQGTGDDPMREYFENPEIGDISLCAIAMRPPAQKSLYDLLKQQGACRSDQAKRDLMKKFLNQELALKLLDALEGLAEQSWVHQGINPDSIFADPEKAEIEIKTPWEPVAITERTIFHLDDKDLLQKYLHPALARKGSGVGFEQDLYSAGMTLMRVYLRQIQGRRIAIIRNFDHKIDGLFQPLREDKINNQQAKHQILIYVKEYSNDSAGKEWQNIAQAAYAFIEASLCCDQAGKHQPIRNQEDYKSVIRKIRTSIAESSDSLQA